MKKLFILLVVSAMCVASYSQERVRSSRMQRMNPTEQATAMATRIKEKCQLSDEQYTKVYELYLAQATANKARRDSIQAAREQMDAQSGATEQNQRGPHPNRDNMRKQNEAFNASIKAILTDEQFKIYQEMQEVQKRNQRNNRPRVKTR